jgi:hypothetical protein
VIPPIETSTALSLEALKSLKFSKGGDRASVMDLPKKEVDVCEKNNIAIVFKVGEA